MLILTHQSKPKFLVMLLTLLAKNLLVMKCFTTNTYMDGFVWFANIAKHGPILRKVTTWDLKGHDLC
jgi:hypothetical protein